MPDRTADAAIELFDVRKTYARRIEALRGVDLHVRRGEIFGLLGPNGAGKSTLVKILLTIVWPDTARGTVLGGPLGDRRRLARVGYLPENHRFPPHLNALQLLDYCGGLSKVPRAQRRARAPELLARVGMSEWAAMRIGKYSKGMMQRLGIAQALLNDPELIVLDEPTDGLDPLGRRDVRTLLVELRERGKTVLLNSHLLSELEMVCDRVAILVRGEVARHGPLHELTGQSVTCRITVRGDAVGLRAEIENRGGALREGAIFVDGNDPQRVNAIIDLLRRKQLEIESVVPQRTSLEDVFVQAAQERQSGASRSHGIDAK